MRDSCEAHMRVQQAKSEKEWHECMRKQITVKEKFKKKKKRDPLGWKPERAT